MTATVAEVKPKRTSGRSTWRAPPNVRRARKLDRKTRQIDSNNVFRWYRAGWGRYTQADPIRPAYPSSGLKANARFDRNKRPEVSSRIEPYAYAGDSPLNSIDALGLARCIYLPIQALS